MKLERVSYLFALGALALLGAPSFAVECWEVHPIICTTNSEQFFQGINQGPLQFIDFETLPNGQPSVGGEQITPAFNYTSLGVTFSTPIGTPLIGGSSGQHDLVALALFPPNHTWIRADLVHPSFGVGIYFPGSTTLRAFDASDTLIASMTHGFSGGPWFIGIYSEIPIHYVTIDRGSTSERINEFIFSPIPEPATLALLALAAAFPRRRS